MIIGAPYRSGILVSDLGPDALHDYHEAPFEILARARRTRVACDGHNVALKAAALQFVLAHPAVTSAMPGSSSPEHVEMSAAMMQYDTPQELGDELRQEGLIADDTPAPK